MLRRSSPVKGLHAAAALGVAADGEHLLHRALGHHMGFAGFVLHHGGQAAAGKVEGDLVHLHIMLGQVSQPGIGSFLLLGLADDGQIHQVFVAGLEIAVQIGVAQHPGVLFPVQVPVVFQHHLILGEGSGLVGAEHVDGAEVLDGIQILDDGLFLAHGHRTLGKAGGHDHGQHLGGKAHCDGDAEQKGIQPVALGQPVDEEHQRNHHQHEADQHPGHRVHAPGEAGFPPLRLPPRWPWSRNRVASPTQTATAVALPGNHAAAHEGDVGQIGHVLLRLAHRGVFFHRFALAGEAGLAEE